MNQELVISADGSHTLFVPEIDEHYHSVYGAIQESKHIFIEAGLNFCTKNPIKILEIGFGTGLNAFLTLLEAIQKNIQIEYHSIELYPVSMKLVNKLNYFELVDKDKKDLFFQLHQTEWNQKITINKNFILYKIHSDLQSFTFSENYDLVYFDAFSPEKQPEMWSNEVFEKISKHLSQNAILTTYCVKGVLKQTLRSLGFTIQRLKGAAGKKQMLRAIWK